MIRAAEHGAFGRAAMALAALTSAAVIAGCSGVSTSASTAQAPATQQSTTAAAPHRHPSSPRPHRRPHRAPPPAALPVSKTSSIAVQPQPAPGSCHARGSGLFSLPDPHCTPGAISPAVTQADIQSTICSYGYTDTVRPPESVTEPEKEASLAAYGDTGPLRDYEYDHLVPLELGGAPNDPRNLWPEPGASPNPKDAVEAELRQNVCERRMSLAAAQRAIATNWVLLAHRRTAKPPPRQTPKPPSVSAATCSAHAQYNSRYGNWDVYVHSHQPDKPVSVSGAGSTRTWHTDASGYADVYFEGGRSAGGEQVTVQVGAASCSTRL